MKVYFIGAGPGDPELITVKGKRRLSECPVVLYAGSLVPEELLQAIRDDGIASDAEKDAEKALREEIDEIRSNTPAAVKKAYRDWQRLKHHIKHERSYRQLCGWRVLTINAIIERGLDSQLKQLCMKRPDSTAVCAICDTRSMFRFINCADTHNLRQYDVTSSS